MKENKTGLETYKGSCHCGKVRFEVHTTPDRIIECNCSICTKKGVLHHRVAPQHFTLQAGKEDLSLYQFGSKVAKHYFCGACGIHTFGRPRSAPEMYSINIRCLDDFETFLARARKVPFDGQNWEEAVRALKGNNIESGAKGTGGK